MLLLLLQQIFASQVSAAVTLPYSETLLTGVTGKMYYYVLLAY